MSLSCLSSLFLYSNTLKTPFLATEAGCVCAKWKKCLNSVCVLSKITPFLYYTFLPFLITKLQGASRWAKRDSPSWGVPVPSTPPLVQGWVHRVQVWASAETHPGSAKGWSVSCLGRATTEEIKKACNGQCPQICVTASTSGDITKLTNCPKFGLIKSHSTIIWHDPRSDSCAVILIIARMFFDYHPNYLKELNSFYSAQE